ncbi:MAG: tRNA lysidine(34) synthetase TilS [Tissierellia bacterium]|nr:tRNA lysidine(34) synthetase TilS [Tissierellia bacterium]
MINRILKTIDKWDMIKPGDTVIVGLSGGADSVFLLHLLNSVKAQLNINIVSAHVNHGVRGEFALNDQIFSEKLSKKMNIPFYTIDVDMNGYAKEHGISSEEAGRILRYDFFRKIGKEYSNYKIAVAHNRDDQVETILMRIMRGTGLDGLAGIPYTRDEIIRPILDISRVDIEYYLNSNGIEYVDDHTNFETDYMRNKIRLKLIPEIEKTYNPKFKTAIISLVDIVREESDYLNIESISVYNKIVNVVDGNIYIDIEPFSKLHIAIKRRVIRIALEQIVSTLEGNSYEQIEDVVSLSEKQTGKRIDNIKGVSVIIEYDKMVLKNNTVENKKSIDKTLEMGINNVYANNSVIIMEIVDKISKTNNKTAYFDCDKLSGNIFVRNRKNGDRIVPTGMTGSKKIKDFFIDEKIPQSQRDEIMVFCDEEKIIWLGGLRQSELTKVDNDTKKILKIEILEDYDE